ncbi:sigma factor-like helix-turn-helix DNA-binding protein [Micromonospora chalcea]
MSEWVDWSVLEYPGVKRIAGQAARRVATDYSSVAEYDDMLQEALLILATHPARVQQCVNGEGGASLGTLQHELTCDLVNKVARHAERAVKSSSLDVLLDAGQEIEQQGEEAPPAKGRGGAYTRELVEQLLPTVWDSSYAFGMANPTAPDPDMPRSKANPKESGTLYAHIADMQSAWKRSGLSLDEKRALLLRYGMGWSEKEIGGQLGSPQKTVSNRLIRGVGRIVDHLNGVEMSEQDW